jgi:hypothetical protein
MEKISKNCYKGELITNPFDVVRLALERKSVYYKNWGVKPAAFYLSQHFRLVIYLITNKLLYFVINSKNINHEQSNRKN